MKKSLIILIFVLVTVSGCGEEKVQVCPDSWWIDAEPPGVRDIFIVGEERYDIDNVDLVWVRENCEIKEAEFVAE